MLEVVVTAVVACLQQQGRENAKNDVLFFNESNEARVDSTFSAAAIPVAPRNKMLVSVLTSISLYFTLFFGCSSLPDLQTAAAVTANVDFKETTMFLIGNQGISSADCEPAADNNFMAFHLSGTSPQLRLPCVLLCREQVCLREPNR